MVIQREILKGIPGSTFLIGGRIIIQGEIIKGIPRSTFTVLKKNPKVHRRKENPTTKNSRSQHECFRIRKV